MLLALPLALVLVLKAGMEPTLFFLRLQQLVAVEVVLVPQDLLHRKQETMVDRGAVKVPADRLQDLLGLGIHQALAHLKEITGVMLLHLITELAVAVVQVPLEVMAAEGRLVMAALVQHLL